MVVYDISIVINVLWDVCLADPECGDVPLLTPGSKEMMSQALKATFSGFTKEQQRLGIPKGNTACTLISSHFHWGGKGNLISDARALEKNPQNVTCQACAFIRMLRMVACFRSSGEGPLF